MTTKTLHDFRPQHAEDCAKGTTCQWCGAVAEAGVKHRHPVYSHGFESDSTVPCTCGLDALLAAQPKESDNERLLFEWFSDTLTGGRAGTWDEVQHALETLLDPRS